MGNVEVKEEWKSLKGLVECGDYYEISNFGNLRSIDREVISKNGAIKRFKGVLRKTKRNNRNYITANLFQDGVSRTVLIHRMVAIAFIENPKNLPEVNHIDGDKNNNNVDNLERVTSKDNQNHARTNGLSNQHGQKSVNSKLSNEDAEKIRKLWHEGGISQYELASLFNVSQSVVSRIVSNKSYKN